jgi:predicted nucleic acid-binding protein
VPAIFIDTNIAIYAAGAPHIYKEPAARVIDLVWQNAELFVSDAEVLQEILHRYVSIRRWGQGRRVFDEFSAVMEDRIEPILPEDVGLASRLVNDHPRLSARDLIHLAVMRRLGVTRIVTTDGGFQGLPGIERLDPARIEEWRGSIG